MSARQADTLPPVAEMCTVSLALVVIGGIFLASYVPRRPPLGVPIALLVVADVLTGTGVAMIGRLSDRARRSFTTVAKWALLAYVVTSGMIEFAFVKDHTRGAPLAVVTLMLVVFAVDVPLIIGFTIARLERPEAA